MDCCTCFLSLFKDIIFKVKNIIHQIKTYQGLLFVLLFFSTTAKAESSLFSSFDPIQSFVLGIFIPIILFGLWRLIKRLSVQEVSPSNEHVLTQDELFNYTHDLTTNLPTAQHALSQFEVALKSSKEANMAAIVFKPINFQQVNSVLGHHNSDLLLLQLAYSIQQKVAENQNLLSFDKMPEAVRLARLSGLDFLIVLDLSQSKHENVQVIDNLCRELLEAVPQAMSFKSFSLNFELAFGVAFSDKHGRSVNEIVAHATDALLTAEAEEQAIVYFDNSVVLYTEKQLALMEHLRNDIINENLHWVFQPQVDIEDKSIIGFELKVFWHQDDKTQLELHQFVELAEHSGEVYNLTKQMFKKAFKTLFSLHKMGVYQPISVNLSSSNLLEPDLIDYIEHQMKNFNIAGKYLMIELKEQVMISACQRAKNVIDQLKSLDIVVSISDFSGSYESLRYLRKMSIHQVKINCNRLGDYENNRADKAIINALITLTSSMKIPLIGTDINKQESVNDFVSMGGRLVQGNVISHGVALDDIENWLESWLKQHPKL